MKGENGVSVEGGRTKKLPRSISIGRAAFVPCPGTARLRLGRGSEPAVMEAESLRVMSRIGPEQ